MEDATDGVPGHLKEGWTAYREWWEARYRSGDPLPAGGVFILNRRAVLLDELWRLHVEAAAGLGVPVEAITIDLQTDAQGRIRPEVGFTPPNAWVPPVPAHVRLAAGSGTDQIVQEFVSGFLKRLYSQMQARLTSRVESLSRVRQDLG